MVYHFNGATISRAIRHRSSLLKIKSVIDKNVSKLLRVLSKKQVEMFLLSLVYCVCMRIENKRERAHNEIEQIAEEISDSSRVETYSLEEAEERLEMGWPYLAEVFFSSDESLNTVHELRDELRDNQFLVRVEEKDGGTCLTVEVTYELYEERYE